MAGQRGFFGKRPVGAGRLETLLADTLTIALDTGATKPTALERVTVDTTVQTKAVAYPTDGHLMLRAIERLAALARQQGLTLRQGSQLSVNEFAGFQRDSVVASHPVVYEPAARGAPGVAQRAAGGVAGGHRRSSVEVRVATPGP